MPRAAAPSSGGCARTCWTSARSTAFRTSPCGRTARCTGTSSGSGTRCGDRFERGRRRPASPASASTRGAATTRCSANAANCCRTPIHYRDSRTDGVMEAVFKRVSGRRDLWRHRHPVPALQHPVSALRRVPADAAADRRGDTRRDDSRPAQLLADRIAGRRIHQRHDDAVRGCADAVLGDASCSTQLGIADAAAAADRRAWHAGRPAAGRRVADAWPARRSSRRPATTPARRSRRLPAARRRAFLSSGTWSLLGTEVRRAGDHGAIAGAELHQRRRRVRHDATAQEHRRACGCCRRAAGRGRRQGTSLDYDELLTMASDERHGVQGRCSIRITRRFCTRATW